MKYIDEFRVSTNAENLVKQTKQILKKPVSFMEFCGGHTVTLLKYGIIDILAPEIKMVSGPGCPVCVTSQREIDEVIELSRKPNVIIASFGDMIRVKGSTKSLSDQKAYGADVRIIYSPDDAVTIATENPNKKVIFFAVGFETTAPVTAASIKLAEKSGIENYFVYSAHKTTTAVLDALLSEPVKLDGFVCPGHVTAITGISVYNALIKENKPCVVSGFEPLDLLQSVYMLVNQVNSNCAKAEIQYSRVVKKEGNLVALSLMKEVFRPVDANWRGIGVVAGSGLVPGGAYSKFNAKEHFDFSQTGDEVEEKGCICGKILRGINTPLDCPLFRSVCKPENPIGACMVSDEGTCSGYFRFAKR